MDLTYYSQTNLIEAHEFLLAQFYILFIFFFTIFIRRTYYQHSPLKKYYFPALGVKILGAIGVTLLYNYYYEGGDTCNYFRSSKTISSLLLKEPLVGIRLLFSQGGNFAPDLVPYVKHLEHLELINIESSYLIIKIAAFLELFTFQSFLITAILFGYISFFAIWKLFTVFCGYYPSLARQLALAFLFLPSVFFWGSGILKDTVCYASLAVFFVCIDGLFLKGKNKIKNALGILISGYILTIVKVYIIMSFTICIIILIFLIYRSRIRNGMIRIIVAPVLLALALISGTMLVQFISESATTNRYTFENILQTSEVTRDFIYSVGGGSSYSLGEIDNSVWGMIKVIPAGINVTLFRPYLWETHNLIAFIAALESLFLFILTLSILIKTGFFRFFKTIFSNNIIFFCIIFSITFAYFVGITSFNFGTLTRYKIPCIPFYVAGLYMIYFTASKKKTKKLGLLF